MRVNLHARRVLLIVQHCTKPVSNAITRVIAVGASNLTRGFQAVVSTARTVWGREVEVIAALGHGRSYGAQSRFIGRTLPGILESDLWDTLARLPPASARALMTDVGNDILYGYSPAQIVDWVDETADRLQRITSDVILTDLPLGNIRRLSNARFLFFRSVLFPSSRLSLVQVADRAAEVNEGLASLAAARGLRFFQLKSEWYGFDPVHIQPSQWRHAWQDILCGEARAIRSVSSWSEGMRLYVMRPQRQWLFGVEQVSPQAGLRLPAGGRVWLY